MLTVCKVGHKLEGEMMLHYICMQRDDITRCLEEGMYNFNEMIEGAYNHVSLDPANHTLKMENSFLMQTQFGNCFRIDLDYSAKPGMRSPLLIRFAQGTKGEKLTERVENGFLV